MLALSRELIGHRLAAAPAPLPRPMAGSIGILAVLAFLSEGIWQLTRHLGTIAHEGMHALTGWCMGRKVTGVKLYSNGDGETASLGPSTGAGRVITAFAGYAGPSLFGLGTAELTRLGQVTAALSTAVILLIVLLVLIRNSFGLLSILLTGGILVLVLARGDARLQAIAAYSLSWALLLSGVRIAFTHRSGAGDAGTLTEITHIPRFLWAACWMVMTALALWAGGRLLLA